MGLWGRKGKKLKSDEPPDGMTEDTPHLTKNQKPKDQMPKNQMAKNQMPKNVEELMAKNDLHARMLKHAFGLKAKLESQKFYQEHGLKLADELTFDFGTHRITIGSSNEKITIMCDGSCSKKH
jgi:hypothetical protein